MAEFLLLFTGDAAGAKAAMGEVEGGMAGLDSQGSGLMGTLSKVFVGIAVAAVAAGVAFGAVALKMASDYQATTASIAANSGSTIAQAKGVTDAFLTTAGKSTFSAQEMATAYAAAAGQFTLLNGTALDAAQALDVENAAAMGAEATHGDLTAITQTLASTLLAFKLPVSDAATVMAQLTNVSRLTGQPISDIGAALDKLKARLGTSAPSISDVSTLMVELSSAGLQGSRGMLVANTAFQTLVGGSKATTAELSHLGVSIFNSSGQFVGLQSVIGQLQPKLAGMTQQQQDLALKTLFGASASQVMGGIIQGGLSGYDAASGKVNDLAKAHQAAADNANTLAGKMETAKAAVDDFTVKVGNELLPMVEGAVTAFSTWLIPALSDAATWLGTNLPLAIAAVEDWFQQNQGTIETVAGILAGTLHAAISITVDVLGFLIKNLQIFGPILGGVVAGLLAWKAAMAIQALITGVTMGMALFRAGLMGATAAEVGGSTASYALGAAIRFAMGPIGLIVIAIAGIIAIGLLLITHWKLVSSIAESVWKDVSGFFTSLWKDIVGIWNGIMSTITGVVKAILSWLSTNWPYVLGILGGPIGEFVAFVATHISQILAFFKALPGNIMNAIAGLDVKIIGFFAGIWSTVYKDVGNFVTGVINFFLSLPGKIASAIGNMVSTVLNKVKQAANSIPVIGGALSAIGLATGGYVEKPTFAVIAENEPEYVIPKSKWLAGVQPLASTTSNSRTSSVTGGTTVAISVNGLTAADVVPAIRQEISNWAGQVSRLTHR